MKKTYTPASFAGAAVIFVVMLVAAAAIVYLVPWFIAFALHRGWDAGG